MYIIYEEAFTLTFHQLSSSETVQALHTDPAVGLDARQAQERLGKFGENKLAEKKKKPISSASLPSLKM